LGGGSGTFKDALGHWGAGDTATMDTTETTPLLCGAVGADTHTPHGPSHIAFMAPQPTKEPPTGPASAQSVSMTTTIAQRR